MRSDVKAYLDLLAVTAKESDAPLPKLYALSPPEARKAYAALIAMADLPAHNIARIETINCPGPAGDLALTIYDNAPETEAPRPAILFFHGGGFVVGSPEAYRSICTDMAVNTGLPVIAPAYRLAPEHPFPAAPDDCEAAARYIAEHDTALGLNLSGLIPMGDSAGGNLAIVTALALGIKPAALPVVMAVSLYPVAGPVAGHQSFQDYSHGHGLDLPLLAWFTQNYAGDDADWRCYPILSPDLARLPPLILATAEYDPLRDSGRDFAAQAIENGIDLTYTERRGTVHMFMNLRKIIPSSQSDMDVIYQAINGQLEREN